MAADVAGSALSEKGVSPRKWVKANLTESQFLTKEQMHEVVLARLDGKELRMFQKAVAGSKANVLFSSLTTE